VSHVTSNVIFRANLIPVEASALGHFFCLANIATRIIKEPAALAISRDDGGGPRSSAPA